MKRSLLALSLLAGLLGFSAFASAAEDPAAAAEARLRENLRATTLQLRTAQNDLVSAQSARDALAAEKKTLEADLEKLRKQLVADRAETDKAIAALKAAAAEQAAELAATRAELAKTRESLAKVVDYAKKTETERNDLSSRLAQTETRADDYRSRNVALYKLGNEILDRYAKFSLGDALGAREPFIGTSRVKLENLIQEYDDRLRAQRAPVAAAATP